MSDRTGIKTKVPNFNTNQIPLPTQEGTCLSDDDDDDGRGGRVRLWRSEDDFPSTFMGLQVDRYDGKLSYPLSHLL